MRVLAAAFADEVAATRALEELRSNFGIGTDDASIAPLGDAGHGAGMTVLGGHFGDDEVPAIRGILEQHGGQVLSDVDERWTRSLGIASTEPETEGPTA